MTVIEKQKENKNKMKYLRCKCGKREAWTTDSSYDCQGCSECKTTLAVHSGFHKPLQPHAWEMMYHQGKPYNICSVCHKVDENPKLLGERKQKQQNKMKVKDIILKAIKEAGADGLCLVEQFEHCGCGIDDFMPCDSGNIRDCELAKKEKFNPKIHINQPYWCYEEGDTIYTPLTEGQ